MSNPHPCQAVFTHSGAWSPQSPLNSRRAIIGGGCPLSCPAVYAKLGFQERLSPTVACINTAICYSFATFFAPAKVLVEIPSAGLKVLEGVQQKLNPKSCRAERALPPRERFENSRPNNVVKFRRSKKHLATPGEVHSSSRGPRGNLKLHHEELKSFAELAGVPQSKVAP